MDPKLNKLVSEWLQVKAELAPVLAKEKELKAREAKIKSLIKNSIIEPTLTIETDEYRLKKTLYVRRAMTKGGVPEHIWDKYAVATENTNLSVCLKKAQS